MVPSAGRTKESLDPCNLTFASRTHVLPTMPSRIWRESRWISVALMLPSFVSYQVPSASTKSSMVMSDLNGTARIQFYPTDPPCAYSRVWILRRSESYLLVMQDDACTRTSMFCQHDLTLSLESRSYHLRKFWPALMSVLRLLIKVCITSPLPDGSYCSRPP
jgi:hypothetical protein